MITIALSVIVVVVSLLVMAAAFIDVAYYTYALIGANVVLLATAVYLWVHMLRKEDGG